MDAAERLLRLLSLLQSRPHWSGAALAERLGVTTRTLRRDVTRLRSLGYPVDAAVGLAGGYRLGSGGRLPPLLLDDEEAVAIVVGLRVATTTSMSGVEDAAVAALAKLDQVLPSRLRERVRAVQASTVQMPDPALPQVDADILVVLATGCRRSECVRFAYRNHAGDASVRLVEPYQIVHTGRRWYLVARDRDRGAWRTFRVDRIAEPVLTGQRYELEDPPPDPIALVAEGTSFVPWPVKARILLSTGLDEAARLFPPRVGVLEPVGPTSTLLRVATEHLDALVQFVAGIPCEFEVLEPPDLRERMRDKGEQLVRRHT